MQSENRRSTPHWIYARRPIDGEKQRDQHVFWTIVESRATRS